MLAHTLLAAILGESVLGIQVAPVAIAGDQAGGRQAVGRQGQLDLAIGEIGVAGLVIEPRDARGVQVLPTPKGENVVIITGAGGSGVLLSDACFDNGLTLMKMPDDLDAAFRKFIPPFGAAGNPPVDPERRRGLERKKPFLKEQQICSLPS